jgi:hypothetical protein
MASPFFDELRLQETILANGKQLPQLFNFSAHGNLYFNFRIID